MPKRKAAAGAEVASRRSPRLAAKPQESKKLANKTQKAAPKKAAKGKKAKPAENGDAKPEAPKVDAAADAK